MTKGSTLEKTINKINLSHRVNKESLILKIPTPILLTKNGLQATKSTVDFSGLIKNGTFIAYDCKECASTTSFPLANIKQHQLEYLKLVRNLGGLAFFIIHFVELSAEVYITPLHIIQKYFENETRKSIPVDDFKKEWLCKPENYIQKCLEIKEELSLEL